MNAEKINNLIDNSDMVNMQKNIAKGFIARAKESEEKKKEIRLIVDLVVKKNTLYEILFSSNEVIIYSITGKDEWDILYPVRCIFMNDKGNWERNITVSPDFESAYLDYLGCNSQFADFAERMLKKG